MMTLTATGWTVLLQTKHLNSQRLDAVTKKVQK